MWECGLKHYSVDFHYHTVKSLLMWECGLKLFHIFVVQKGRYVTPYVGVWIET